MGYSPKLSINTPQDRAGSAVRVGKALTTLGGSEVDAATGNHVSNALTKIAGDLDPTKKPNYGEMGMPDPAALQQIDASKYSMPTGQAAPQLNTSPQDQFRAQQLQLANQLSNQAQGIGPSVAQNQLRRGQSANLAATMAQLASARGGANPGLARQAIQTSANIQNQTNQAAATARLQEQMLAAGLLGQVAGSARGQDIGVAGQNAQLQQGFQDLQQKYAGMGLNAQQANQQAALEFARLQQTAGQYNATSDTQEEKDRRQAIGKIVNAGGALAAQKMGAPAASGQVM